MVQAAWVAHPTERSRSRRLQCCRFLPPTHPQRRPVCVRAGLSARTLRRVVPTGELLCAVTRTEGGARSHRKPVCLWHRDVSDEGAVFRTRPDWIEGLRGPWEAKASPGGAETHGFGRGGDPVAELFDSSVGLQPPSPGDSVRSELETERPGAGRAVITTLCYDRARRSGTSIER